MKRSFAMLTLMLLAAGCVGVLDSPVVPMNMPVAQAVTQIDVTPRGQTTILSIKKRHQIDSIMKALEGERKDWYRPVKFPTEQYTLTIISNGGRSRDMLLGDGWFGGPCGETKILRRLTAPEEEEIRALLGVKQKADG